MKTQAIKILEEMYEKNKSAQNSEILLDAIDEISSLPSLDIDILQRYDGIMGGSGIKSDKGVFIRYDDLKALLK